MISFTHSPRMRFRAYIAILSFILIFSLFIPSCYNDYKQLNQRWQQIHVDRKEAVKMHNGKYLVYTKQEVFEVSDSWLEWIIGSRFAMASSDTYGMIEEGKDYLVRTRGFRWPFWSFYRNIVEIKEVGEKTILEKRSSSLLNDRRIPPRD